MVGVVQRPTIVGSCPTVAHGEEAGGRHRKGGRIHGWEREKGKIEEGEWRDPASGSVTTAAAGGQHRGGRWEPGRGGGQGGSHRLLLLHHLTAQLGSVATAGGIVEGVAGVGGSWVRGEGEDLLDGTVGGVDSGVVVVPLASDT
jgi:hypothetical protein